MKYALISNIHGNLPALEAVLEDIDSQDDVEAVYHLGDLIGYAPWPNEVVALVRERGIPGIAGNYDSTTAHDYDHCGCKADTPHQEELSHQSYEWTRGHVSTETKRFLGESCPSGWTCGPGAATSRSPRWFSLTARRPSTPSTGPKTVPTPSVRRWRTQPEPEQEI